MTMGVFMSSHMASSQRVRSPLTSMVEGPSEGVSLANRSAASKSRSRPFSEACKASLLKSTVLR